METVNRRAEAGDFTPPIHKEMMSAIGGIGAGLARLYAEEYQVMPYVYTHLVSLSCFLYLLGWAFLKGLLFGSQFGSDLELTLGKFCASFGLDRDRSELLGIPKRLQPQNITFCNVCFFTNMV